MTYLTKTDLLNKFQDILQSLYRNYFYYLTQYYTHLYHFEVIFTFSIISIFLNFYFQFPILIHTHLFPLGESLFFLILLFIFPLLLQHIHLLNMLWHNDDPLVLYIFHLKMLFIIIYLSQYDDILVYLSLKDFL